MIETQGFIDLIANQGIAIGVCVFFMLKTDKTITDNNRILTELTTLIRQLSNKEEK